MHWESSINISLTFLSNTKSLVNIYFIVNMATAPNGSSKPQANGSDCLINGERMAIQSRRSRYYWMHSICLQWDMFLQVNGRDKFSTSSKKEIGTDF